MNRSVDLSFTVWFALFALLTAGFILQSSFLAVLIPPSFVPYVLWPPLLFFFLYRGGLSSVVLICFVSALSSVFLSLSVSILFFIYLLFFAGVSAVKQFFYSKSILFFTGMVFGFSFFCSYLIEGLSRLEFSFSSSSSLFYFYKSFMTSVLAVILFPIFKKRFPISKEI